MDSLYQKNLIKTARWFGLEAFSLSMIAPSGSPDLAEKNDEPEQLQERTSEKTTESPKTPPVATKKIFEPKQLQKRDKMKAMDDLIQRASQCQLCRLCETRNKVVVGSGSIKAGLMLVGEGPGADEDRQGLPFVGKAGQLLTKMLKAISFEREEVYITNVIKCRPPQNRDPQADEILACGPYLVEQIKLIQPKIILTLGAYASRTLLKKEGSSLGSLRGKIWDFEKIPLLATYHPAALLRNPQYKKPTWEDLKKVQEFFR